MKEPMEKQVVTQNRLISTAHRPQSVGWQAAVRAETGLPFEIR